MDRFIGFDLPFSGLKILKRKEIHDGRGSFSRLFCSLDLLKFGWETPIAQINRSCSTATGTIRGLHFQRPPHGEMKLVSCIRGRVYDVVVDLRKNSPTFLQWHAEYLSSDNCNALMIPQGFAHGFQSLTDETELIYVHSAPFWPDAEGGLNPMDPYLDIVWPIPISNISLRDSKHPYLDSNFEGIES